MAGLQADRRPPSVCYEPEPRCYERSPRYAVVLSVPNINSSVVSLKPTASQTATMRKRNVKIRLLEILLSSLIILGSVPTGGTHPRKDVVSRRCHQCGGAGPGADEAPTGRTAPPAPAPCDSSKPVVPSALCPSETPYCATFAKSPDFTSVLICASAGERPCSLIYNEGHYWMTCMCAAHLCNAPFTSQMQRELQDFARTNIPTVKNGTLDFVEALWNISRYGNTVDDSDSIYKIITVPIKESYVFPSTTIMTTDANTTMGETPRAFALSDDSTAPSDDDEDDIEGSGIYHSYSYQSSTPAEPSTQKPPVKSLGVQTIATVLAYILVAVSVLLFISQFMH